MILSLLLLASSLHATDIAYKDVDAEKLDILGWGDGCSVAVEHYGYPPPGPFLEDDPIMARIGVMSMAPGAAKETDQWMISLHGNTAWRKKEADKVLEFLNKKGYTKPGVVEEIGLNPVVDQRDLPRLLNTTDSLKATPGRAWPDKNWRWTEIVYEPLSTCALFIYELRGTGKPLYNYLLVRIGSNSARADRALAHLTNALLLLDKGDLNSALSESEIAARLEPDNASMRYHHAALMTLSGIVEPAVDELEAAIKLDSKYRARARKDKDLDDLRWHPRFKEITR